MRSISMLLVVASMVTFGGCGQALHQTSASMAAQSGSLPHFAATGKTFSYSSACTPDALRLGLVVGVDHLQVSYRYVTADSQDYSLDFASQQITASEQPGQPTVLEPATARYSRALAAMRKAAAKVAAGSNRCSPAHAELSDVVAYLNGRF